MNFVHTYIYTCIRAARLDEAKFLSPVRKSVRPKLRGLYTPGVPNLIHSGEGENTWRVLHFTVTVFGGITLGGLKLYIGMTKLDIKPLSRPEDTRVAKEAEGCQLARNRFNSDGTLPPSLKPPTSK